jgi:putative transposase
MQYIKGNFSFRLKSKLDVWERSYTNHRIKDTTDYTTHTVYIHQNPVRANLTTESHLYPYSSADVARPSDLSPSHFA